MIPQRVQLKGFLCYKDEQEICFDGASLWLLAGLNGSGKSTIFDAITFALFGHHRGGSRDAHELINKDSDKASITFEFTIDGKPFQIARTIQRTKQGKGRGAQQIARGLAVGGWEPVEGTNLMTGFDEWISQHIGLSYETFTSSVLLLQGRAEKLLDSTAKGRFEVLAGIVDLERFRKLHERADEERKTLDDRLKEMRGQLNSLPAVSAIDLLEAEGDIAAAETAKQQAQEQVERWQQLEYQAKQWAELQARLEAARKRWQEAQRLLADAVAIKRDVDRLAELRLVLPKMQVVLEQRGYVQESERKTAELTKRKEKLDGDLVTHDQALEQARQKRTLYQKQIADEEQQLRQVTADLRKVAALIVKLKESEQQENDLKRVREELAQVGADPEAAVRQAREQHDQLATQASALPLLGRLHTLRDELRQGRERAGKSSADMQTIFARGKQVGLEVERFKGLLEEATQTRQQADETATTARTLRDQAKGHLDELLKLGGAKVCRHCGQELTPNHLQDEKKRRTKALSEAEEQLAAATTTQKAKKAQESQLRKQYEEATQHLREAREEYRERKAQADQAVKDVERLERECGVTYHDLTEPFRNQVSPTPPEDWCATAFPQESDLEKLRRQTRELDGVKKTLRDAEDRLQKWTQAKAREATVQQNLARVLAELPRDREPLRRDHARLETDEQTLDKTLRARRREADEVQQQLDRLAQQREKTQRLLGDVTNGLHSEEATRKQCQHTLERTLRELSEAWRPKAERAGMTELNLLKQEVDDLTRKQTDERARKLSQAQGGLDLLKQDQDNLEQEQEQFAEEARQPVAEMQVRLKAAQQTRTACEQQLVAKQHRKEELERQHQKRQELEEKNRQVDQEFTESKLLAELLGRDRLQLHLVRQAERQVVDFANAVLDRLSGGQLRLRLAGEAGGEGNTAKALELEVHNRVTGEKPINVAFLSGSQKFRVAVSLALGIGQYASKQHRPIESVIIDEGFGCLDRHGRQVMIEELKNLRNQMRCILLVSHQEEFVDAFSDGYRFELNNGSTVAKRFQR